MEQKSHVFIYCIFSEYFVKYSLCFLKYFPTTLAPILHNVPVVYDVARPPLKQCVALRGRAMWRRENPTKGASPTGVFLSLARLKRAYIYNPVKRRYFALTLNNRIVPWTAQCDNNIFLYISKNIIQQKT